MKKNSRCGSLSGGRWLGFTCLGTIVFTTVYLIGTNVLQWSAVPHNSFQGRKIIQSILVEGGIESANIKKALEDSEIRHVVDDSKLVSYIRSSGILREPSTEPYNLIELEVDPLMTQGYFIGKLFQDQKDGFFVEYEAFDGETRTNTLTLEMDLGWSGLLIEGDPKTFDLLVSKNRKAWTANTCLSTKPVAEYFKETPGTITPECLPLCVLLASLNISVVDFLSLQVGGNEFNVLKSLPFNNLTIKALSVEFFHVPQGLHEINEFMKSKGYLNIKTTTNHHDWANDLVFLHSDYQVLLDNLNS